MKMKEIGFNGFKVSRFLMLFMTLILTAACVLFFCFTFESFGLDVFLKIIGVLGIVFVFISFGGYMMLEPNEARAMVFFGKYVGTFTETGFFWVNPFLVAKKVSLRARNLDVAPIKVNDKIGNPILIGLVLVWKLKDTSKALFEIDSQPMAMGTPGQANVVVTVAGRIGAFDNFV